MDRTAAIVARVDRGLRAAGNPARALAEKGYLKSDLEFVGAGVPAIRAVARRIHKTDPGLVRTATLKIARTLWSDRVFERRLAAVELLRASLDALEPRDIDLIERLIRQSKTWALVDSLATDVTSPLIERHPVLLRILDRWAADRDFWVRRSALLALLPPMRRGAARGSSPASPATRTPCSRSRSFSSARPLDGCFAKWETSGRSWCMSGFARVRDAFQG